jgi:hypothetical protein
MEASQLTLFDYEEMPLASLEHIIERGLSTFIEVGMALMAIREGKKYKDAGYTDFNVYIEERWGMSKSRGNQLLTAGYITTEISTIVDKMPDHETQVRPLSRLGTSERSRDGFPQPECWIEKSTERLRNIVTKDGVGNAITRTNSFARLRWLKIWVQLYPFYRQPKAKPENSPS